MFFIEVYNIESEVDFHDLIRDRTVHVILVSGSVLRTRSPKPPIKSMHTLVYIAIKRNAIIPIHLQINFKNFKSIIFVTVVFW